MSGSQIVNPILNSQIKALVFDAYGTLFDVHSVIAECNRVFPGQGNALSELWRSRQLQYTWLRSLMGQYADFWQVTGEALEFACRALSLAYSPELGERLLNQYWKLDAFGEVPAALRSLHKRLQLAILSNGTPQMLETVARNAGVREHFDAILSADTIRVYKPDPRVYELAPRELGLARDEMGFVSSNSFDVAGAKNFGFYAIWLHRHPAPFDVLGIEADVEINNLSELVNE